MSQAQAEFNLQALGSKSTTLPILLISVLAAIASSITIYQLHQAAEYSNETRLLLTQAKEQMSRLNSLEWEGFAKGEIDENLAEELAENEASTTAILTQLQEGDRQKHLQDFLGLYNHYQVEINYALNLIAQGRISEAKRIEVNDIDEIYDALYEKVSELELFYIAQKERTRYIADIGTTFSLLISALVISILSYKFNANLWRKNQDLKTAFQNLQQAQEQLIQQEKMAALGQLIAGVAHEINNLLGVIRAAAANSHKALQDILEDLPLLQERLKPDEQGSFFVMTAKALQSKPAIASSESRTLRRQLTTQLQPYGFEDERYIAETLVDMGISCDDFDALIPIFNSEHREWLIQLGYNLTCPFVNNRMIQNAVDRSSKIVYSLKSYAHFDHSGTKKLLNVSDGIETVLEIYHNHLKYNIQVIRDYQDVPPIWGYPDELIQVWTNLIHNAIQAMQSGGILTLRITQQMQGVQVSIIDNGTGIPLATREKVFDAFFTTKESGEGSGLGLYISQKIVDKHQGKITVESQIGETCFSVWLPLRIED